ncbi:MAG: carbon storage regulator [Alphaproteobacteria bacterium]|nr:carbon storage regulator [Alphaproteobacteria bacterium]
MLYLTRRVGQSVMIGDEIELFVEEVRGRTVKLGIRHPAGVTILRRELYDRIRSENIRAVDPPLDPDHDDPGAEHGEDAPVSDKIGETR